MTQGFELYNLSGHTLKLISVVSEGLGGNDVPPVGTALPSGGRHHWEITYWFGVSGNREVVDYAILDGAGNTIGHVGGDDVAHDRERYPRAGATSGRPISLHRQRQRRPSHARVTGSDQLSPAPPTPSPGHHPA